MTRQICARCQQSTDEPVIVGMEHGASVGGRTTYACPDCAPSFPKQIDVFAAAAAMRQARETERAIQTGWA
ncbi:hypothetical protein ABZS86_14600 [Streptomyces sp. NPDC005355]|uniref:hypothetical protein n=1 Tax=Streptomyces sp. NPDC005355 TaxID=3157038 RepID=UPI0033A3123A